MENENKDSRRSFIKTFGVAAASVVAVNTVGRVSRAAVTAPPLANSVLFSTLSKGDTFKQVNVIANAVHPETPMMIKIAPIPSVGVHDKSPAGVSGTWNVSYLDPNGKQRFGYLTDNALVVLDE